MYGKPQPAVWFDAFPDGGGYPKGFLPWALEQMGCENPDEVLHICSGSVRSGVTVDIREQTKPRIVADARCLPFADSSFRYILIDPPYSETYAETLYKVGKQYPKPGELLKEAGRVCVVNGENRIAALHRPRHSQTLEDAGSVGHHHRQRHRDPGVDVVGKS
jgi:hypothetical protein